jgi:molecular chaperone HscB
VSSPFEILGLPVRFGIPARELEARWKELSRALHPDRHARATPAERRAALSRAVGVNEAYRALSDDLARAQTILSLRGEAIPEDTASRAADPALLMEVMELREALAERRAAKDAAGIERLAADVRAQADAATAVLAHALDVAPDAAAARTALGRLRYFRRFLDEVELARETLSA